MKTRAPLARAAAALCALTSFTSFAHAQELCDSVQIGNETGTAFSLSERRVEPDMFTLEISEPDVCPDSEAVGLKVTACDREQAPRVLLLDTARGVVARSGPADTAAFVYVTVYCADADEPKGDAVESLSVANRFSEQALPDSLLLAEIDPLSTQASSIDEDLPQVKLESRFSSMDQSSIPASLTSMVNLFKERVAPPLGQLGTSSRFMENEPSLGKAKHKPSMFDPLSAILPQSSSSSLSDPSSMIKRLTALRPQQPPLLLHNRSPAWLKRPGRRPSSPWLKLRSLPDRGTRKSISRTNNRPASRSYDYGDASSPYDDGPLYLHWLEEQTDTNLRNTEVEHSAHRPPWGYEHPHDGDIGTNFPLLLEHPSPSSIKHISKEQNRYVPPIHEEDPALLAEWKEELHRSPRPSLPKLLLLLQEPDHPALIRRKCDSMHSSEDADHFPRWSHVPHQNKMDIIPWHPDYPTDYFVDDDDSRSNSPKHYTDDMMREQLAHLAPTFLEVPEHVVHAGCSQCALKHAHTHELVHAHTHELVHAHTPEHVHAHTPEHVHAPDHTHTPLHAHAPENSLEHAHAPENSLEHEREAHLPLDYDHFHSYGPNSHTERPLLTSTIRHSLSWVKSALAVTPEPHMKLKQPNHEVEGNEPLEQPWTFLSQLLLSHPTFRDSTHVIRIR